MTDNLRIWSALEKTDPAHTKGFNRAGGFKGTAIKPIWIAKRLTEQFGPVGIGWGMGEPSFQVVPCDGEILVFCTVSAWHGSRDNVLYGVGGDKAMAKRNSGAFCDDEAFKKAFTDAIGNAFKFTGVGADVHMGLFDDDKYVAAAKAEFDEQRQSDSPKPIMLSDEQRDEIISLSQAANVPLTTILATAKAADLREVPAEMFVGIKRKLNLTLDQKTQQREAA